MQRKNDGCTKPFTPPASKVPAKQTGGQVTNPTFTPPAEKMPKRLG